MNMFNETSLFNTPRDIKSPEKEFEETRQRYHELLRKEVEDLKQPELYTYERVSDIVEKLTSPEGEVFTLERVVNPEAREVEEAQELLVHTFNPNEVDNIEDTKTFIEKNVDLSSEKAFILTVIKNEEGKVIALNQGMYAPAKDEERQNLGYGIAMTGYIVVDPKYRNSKLSRELMRNFYENAGKSAASRGEYVRFKAGECVTSVEPVMNKYGLGRIYFMNSEGRVEEFRYTQPPLEWSMEYGTPAVGSDIAFEHLMIGDFDRSVNQLSREEVVSVVRAFYDYVCVWDRDGFKNEIAAKRYKKILTNFLQEVTSPYASIPHFYMMPKKTREAIVAAGHPVVEHTLADHEWNTGGEG